MSLARRALLALPLALPSVARAQDGFPNRTVTMPGFCPVGPYAVPLAEIADPYGLWLTCEANGQGPGEA